MDSPTVCLGTLALFIPPTCFSRTADLRSGPLASGLLPRRSTFSLCVACPIVLKRGPAWGPEVSVCSLRCRKLFAGFWPDILGVAAQLAVQNPCLHKTVGPVALYLRTHCGRSVGVHVVDVARADNERSEGWFALAWEWICEAMLVDAMGLLASVLSLCSWEEGEGATIGPAFSAHSQTEPEQIRNRAMADHRLVLRRCCCVLSTQGIPFL